MFLYVKFYITLMYCWLSYSKDTTFSVIMKGGTIDNYFYNIIIITNTETVTSNRLEL